VYHQYVVRIDRRDAVRERLTAQGVGTAVHYPLPVHQQPAYAADAWHAGLTVTEAVRDRILSLPMYAQLTPANARAVADALVAALHTL
jgi:dTDP-4-amino-4,6-dideoxygalactose transaminase